jgi:hypothetical protein
VTARLLPAIGPWGGGCAPTDAPSCVEASIDRQSSLLRIVGGFLPPVHGVRPLLSPDVVETVRREHEALTNYGTTNFPDERELTSAYGRLPREG